MSARSLIGRSARFDAGLRELAPGTFAWLQPNGELGESNAGLVAGEGQALLIDTLWTSRLTDAMLAAMAWRGEQPITHALNTHGDGDHTWGNARLGDEVEIIATQAAADQLADEDPAALQRLRGLTGPLARIGSLPLPIVGTLPLPLLPRLPLRALGRYAGELLAPYDFSGIERRMPDRTFSGELTLDVGARAVQLTEVGPAHTPGDAIVELADQGICFAGDIVFAGVTPIMWTGPVANWIAALERILAAGYETVVGGHGPPCGPAELRALRDYWTWLSEAGEPLLDGGASPAQAATALLGSDGFRSAPWAAWDAPERMLVSLSAIDANRRGETLQQGPRQRLALFAGMAQLAAGRG